MLAKISFAILLFINYGFVYSQSINVLEENNGFKEFKLNDNKSKFHEDIAYTSLYKGYVYTGDCCKTAFGSDLDNVILKFDNYDNLKLIEISTSKFYDKQEALKYISIIEKAYGPATSFSNKANDISDPAYIRKGRNFVVLAQLIGHSNPWRGIDYISRPVFDQQFPSEEAMSEDH